MAMADGNTVAERTRDRAEARSERSADELRKQALEDLIDRVMRGEKYPKGYTTGVTLHSILGDGIATDGSDIVDAVVAHVRDRHCIPSLEYRIEKIVRGYFEDSAWLDQRINEMEQEAREEQAA
jgi:hypothetical protein